MQRRYLLTPLFVLLLTSCGRAQMTLSDDRVPATSELAGLLRPDVVRAHFGGKQPDERALAEYLREAFRQRFFYPYTSVDDRFADYRVTYDNLDYHAGRAADHMGKFPAASRWKLPFDYQNGEPVNAYALRHLARQHKMVDVGLLYFAEDRDARYVDYFTTQLNSLNAALATGEYETIPDGNGVYEAFRAGYRVLNWLRIHNTLLGEPAYDDDEQLTTIATLLQTGQHLYARNAAFKSGNHQTRGVSALAMLAILLRDFAGTDAWYDRAMARLGEHLEREINADGFQFERSVHYHMSDINNYFFVYQLHQISGLPVDAAWENQLRRLFTTLAKIAYPDGTAPVLQDDTDDPWAEHNEIAGAMTLGYLLFREPAIGYFAADRVEASMYWFLTDEQVAQLDNIERMAPDYGSLSFPETGYYLMREGWGSDDKMMIISAGLDEAKPDHQHGDMLGVQAVANGHVVLPNYQVRYSLPDFDFFKNSMVKNVALVDDQLIGKDWRGNRGGSGFGKFGELPQPEVIAWKVTPAFDFFAGRHDGFPDVGYTRRVLYVKDDFWIVLDDFVAAGAHTYKQVWQGHYTTEEGPGLLRAVFPDASGLDVYQLGPVDTVTTDGRRGKQWATVERRTTGLHRFTTILYPYKGYDNRIDETAESPVLAGWQLANQRWRAVGAAPTVLSKVNAAYVFNALEIRVDDYVVSSRAPADLYVVITDRRIKIANLGSVTCSLAGARGETRYVGELLPGETLEW